MNEYKQDRSGRFWLEAEAVTAMDKRMKERMAEVMRKGMTRPEQVIRRKAMKKYR